MTWKRARTEEKKNERKEAIYEAAVTLFTKNGYDNVSLNGIAAEAGFTKSNLYRYYTSREEIFLRIFSELFATWSEACLKDMRNVETGASIEEFAVVWTEAALPHKQLMELMPLLFISLEQNSSYEQLLKFKRLTVKVLAEHGAELVRIFPKLDAQKAGSFLILINSTLASLWASSAYNETLASVYDQEEFQVLKPVFDRDVNLAVTTLLRGLLA